MAHIHRLIFIALMLLVSWLPSTSYASFPATTSTNTDGQCTVAPCYKYSSGRTSGYFYTLGSLASAIVAATKVDAFPGWYYASCTGVLNFSAMNCTTDTGGVEGVSVTSTSTPAWTPTYSCPANGTLSGTTCTCAAGFTESNNMCPSNLSASVAALNAMADPRVWVDSTTPTTSFCKDGTLYNGTASAATYDGKQAIIYGPFSSAGAACSTSPTAAPVNTSITCASGTYPGTVNGVSVCSPSSSTNSVAAGPSVAASAPSGSASAPVSAIPNAPPTATGSTASTACTGASCSTTTTYTNSAGAVVGSKVETQPKTTFCQDNPGLSICATSTISVGTCGTAPSCSGDAIQCAIAAQQFKTACAFDNSAAATSEEGGYAAGKLVTGDQTTGLAGNSTTNFGAGSFDQTEFLGAAAGMSDLTVTVFRSTVTLPFSSINIWLERLGVIMQAVTFLLCIRIVSRG